MSNFIEISLQHCQGFSLILMICHPVEREGKLTTAHQKKNHSINFFTELKLKEMIVPLNSTKNE